MTDRIKQVKCGDVSFNIEKLSAVKAVNLKLRIGQLLSPVLPELPGVQAMLTGGKTIDAEMLASLDKVLRELDADKTTNMLVELCETARYVVATGSSGAGDFVKFDEAFVDDLTPAYILAFEIGKFNYAKYLGNVPGLAEKTDT